MEAVISAKRVTVSDLFTVTKGKKDQVHVGMLSQNKLGFNSKKANNNSNKCEHIAILKELIGENVLSFKEVNIRRQKKGGKMLRLSGKCEIRISSVNPDNARIEIFGMKYKADRSAKVKSGQEALRLLEAENLSKTTISENDGFVTIDIPLSMLKTFKF